MKIEQLTTCWTNLHQHAKLFILTQCLQNGVPDTPTPHILHQPNDQPGMMNLDVQNQHAFLVINEEEIGQMLLRKKYLKDKTKLSGNKKLDMKIKDNS